MFIYLAYMRTLNSKWHPSLRLWAYTIDNDATCDNVDLHRVDLCVNQGDVLREH